MHDSYKKEEETFFFRWLLKKYLIESDSPSRPQNSPVGMGNLLDHCFLVQSAYGPLGDLVKVRNLIQQAEPESCLSEAFLAGRGELAPGLRARAAARTPSSGSAR